MRGANWIAVGVLAAFFGGQVDLAHACACCPDVGHRYVERVELDQYEREIVTSVEFGATADISTGPVDYEYVEGIRIRSTPLDISVEKESDRWTFRFDDRSGNTGHLVFEIPVAVTRFEVDPRDPNGAQNSGGGPLLYKEWRLSAAAVGDGLIRDSVGGDQMATLILQGRGSACPSLSDFHAWSLVLYGSRAQVELFGDLVVPQ